MKKTFALAAAGLMASALAASALSYDAEAGLTIPGWNDGDITIGPVTFDPGSDPFIASFSGPVDTTNHNPLKLLGKRHLKFTYLLSEAAFTNEATLYLGQAGEQLIFNNKDDNVGDMNMAFNVGGGPLDFTYCTSGGTPGCISNITGTSSTAATLKIASTTVFQVDSINTAVFFFGDGANDNDISDFVIAVQEVPLPAGVWLLGTALAGLGLARRKRKS